MSQENVEMARRWIDAWNRGDLEWILDHHAPEFELHTTGLLAGGEPVYHGRDGFIRNWNTFRDAWESITIDAERIEDLGDRVLVLYTFHGKGRGSGVEVSLKRANLTTIEDGLFVHVRMFTDWGGALEAVGLSE